MPGPYGSAIIDAFSRADGAPGAPWITPAFGDAFGFNISANQLAPLGNPAGAVYTGANFGPDCEVFMQVPVLPTVGNSIYLGGRITRIDSLFNGYQVRVTPSTGVWVVRRIDLGTSLILGANMNQAFAAGNWLAISCVLNAIEAWFSTDAVAWLRVGLRTDGTYAGAGYPGIEGVDAVARYDNFGAGTVGAVGAQGVGGSGRAVSSDK